MVEIYDAAPSSRTPSSSSTSLSSERQQSREGKFVLSQFTFRQIYPIIALPPLIALISVLAIGLTIDHDRILDYDWTCGKAFLPSFSRIINLPIERTIWTFLVVFHLPLRLFTVAGYYMINIRPAGKMLFPLGHRCCVYISVLLALVELTCTAALTFVGERENTSSAFAQLTSLLEEIPRSFTVLCVRQTSQSPISIHFTILHPFTNLFNITLPIREHWLPPTHFPNPHISGIHVISFFAFAISGTGYCIIATFLFRVSTHYANHAQARTSYYLKLCLATIYGPILLPSIFVFFTLYWQQCYTWAYNVFAILEYTAVLTNIAFHCVALLDLNVVYQFSIQIS